MLYHFQKWQTISSVYSIFPKLSKFNALVFYAVFGIFQISKSVILSSKVFIPPAKQILLKEFEIIRSLHK